MSSRLVTKPVGSNMLERQGGRSAWNWSLLTLNDWEVLFVTLTEQNFSKWPSAD